MLVHDQQQVIISYKDAHINCPLCKHTVGGHFKYLSGPVGNYYGVRACKHYEKFCGCQYFYDCILE